MILAVNNHIFAIVLNLYIKQNQEDFVITFVNTCFGFRLQLIVISLLTNNEILTDFTKI